MIDKFLRGGEVGGGLKGDHEINSNEYAGVRFTFKAMRGWRLLDEPGKRNITKFNQ